jgi:hypothetical protein
MFSQPHPSTGPRVDKQFARSTIGCGMMLRFPAVTLRSFHKPQPEVSSASPRTMLSHNGGSLYTDNTRVFIFPQYRFVALLPRGGSEIQETHLANYARRKPETINTRRRYFSLFVTSLRAQIGGCFILSSAQQAIVPYWIAPHAAAHGPLHFRESLPPRLVGFTFRCIFAPFNWNWITMELLVK